mmetsp:Transcript_9489/g.25270  ORF Transcript_9489/g.25270 Transcript_9489/m.25270 type:complete len:294 (+) Transcript_9489:2085-2966(+)
MIIIDVAFLLRFLRLERGRVGKRVRRRLGRSGGGELRGRGRSRELRALMCAAAVGALLRCESGARVGRGGGGGGGVDVGTRCATERVNDAVDHFAREDDRLEQRVGAEPQLRLRRGARRAQRAVAELHRASQPQMLLAHARLQRAHLARRVLHRGAHDRVLLVSLRALPARTRRGRFLHGAHVRTRFRRAPYGDEPRELVRSVHQCALRVELRAQGAPRERERRRKKSAVETRQRLVRGLILTLELCTLTFQLLRILRVRKLRRLGQRQRLWARRLRRGQRRRPLFRVRLLVQ